MDDRETQQESQEEMNESEASDREASDRESEEIPEKIIIDSGNTSGRSSAAIEISAEDMENGKDFDNEKEEDSSSVTRQNESAYRSPITSLQPEPNEYEDDFENDSLSEEGSDTGRRQMAESDDDQDEDNIGSVSDGEDQDFTGVNLQNGHFILRDTERAPSSSTDELMAGYREGGSVVSDRFSDFSTQYNIQPHPTQPDSNHSPSRGSKFDRLRSAYTRPMKQRPPAHLPPQVERSRPSYGYYMDSDELEVRKGCQGK